MQSCIREEKSRHGHVSDTRVEMLKRSVMDAAPGICTERALIWTEYFKLKENRKKPAAIGIAEALALVLDRKTTTIHPQELIVGNFSSLRVGGSIYPELHGLPIMLDLFRFSGRKTNPLKITFPEKLKLACIIPFWLFRFIGIRSHRSPLKTLRLIADQFIARYYLINESAGISHIAPDYETLAAIGMEGFKEIAHRLQGRTEKYSDSWNFYEGIKIIAEGVARFGERYADLAERMSTAEPDESRRKELQEIARVCRRVPRYGAESFHEALQSVFFVQIALNLESLDNSVCPGRMDQYLLPYYQNDLSSGRMTREKAGEFLGCFSVKMSEIIPVFSKHVTNFHGGMFNGQVVTVGGVDRGGKDATNELSFLFLDIMGELRMRQPNYHARVHAGSPKEYLDRIFSILSSGSNSPALYCDEVIIETMCRNGYILEHARDYTAVGCVEPVSQGRSFSSTDAAIFNVPLMLELALNGGRRFGQPFRSGAGTADPEKMKTMPDVVIAFEKQLHHRLSRLIDDLRAVETANRKYHPTPLTSMLIKGCLDKGICSTGGGALYNFSGIQCVAPVDTGDAFRAIEQAVFTEKRFSLPELVAMLKRNIPDEEVCRYLKKIEKFGNDSEAADRWVRYVIETFASQLSSFGLNTRGGRYVMGLYSVTAHEFFGRINGALPHGRRKGESFGAGISPLNGADRKGPTSALNSMNRLDFHVAANGINFNMKFDPHALRGVEGRNALASLVRTFFRRGGMQVQINVLDPSVLMEARDHPQRYPHLLVRVSGYSAYFNDLTPAMKDEIIARSSLSSA